MYIIKNLSQMVTNGLSIMTTMIAKLYKTSIYITARNIIFANGGDRTEQNIPEMSVEGVEFVFGVGGGKVIRLTAAVGY